MLYFVMCCREDAAPQAPAWTDVSGMAAVVAQPLNSRYSTVQSTEQYSTVQPLNSRVSLSCRAEARPPPSVRWTKDGIPIEEEVTRSLANTYRVRQLRGSIHLVPCTHTRKFIHIIISGQK